MMKKSTSLLLLSTIFTISGSLPSFWSPPAIAMEKEDKDDAAKIKFVNAGAKQLLAFKDAKSKNTLNQMQQVQKALDIESREKYGVTFHAIPVNDKKTKELQGQSLIQGLKILHPMVTNVFKELSAASNEKVKPSSLLFSLDQNYHDDMEKLIAKVKDMDIYQDPTAAQQQFTMLFKNATSKYETASRNNLNEQLVAYKIAQLYKIFGEKLDKIFENSIAKLETEMKASQSKK